MNLGKVLDKPVSSFLILEKGEVVTRIIWAFPTHTYQELIWSSKVSCEVVTIFNPFYRWGNWDVGVSEAVSSKSKCQIWGFLISEPMLPTGTLQAFLVLKYSSFYFLVLKYSSFLFLMWYCKESWSSTATSTTDKEFENLLSINAQ